MLQVDTNIKGIYKRLQKTENKLTFRNDSLCDSTALERSSIPSGSLQTLEKDRKTWMSIKIKLSKPPTYSLPSHPKLKRFPRASNWL